MAVVATPRALHRLDRVTVTRTSPVRSLTQRIARRRWFVVVGLLATLLPALALTLLTDDVYRAESTILLQRTSVDQLLDFDAPINANASRRVNNEIGVIEGVVVYNQVLTKLGLSDAPRAHAIAGGDSDVIVVRVEATTPELAARLANAYVNAYIDVRLRQNNESAALAVSQLGELIENLQTQIDDIDAKMADATPEETAALTMQRANLVADQTEYGDRLRQLRIDTSIGLPPAEVLQDAQPPSSPSEPDRVAVVVAALAAGLALGLVAAFVIDEIDDTLRTVADVGRLAGIGPVLAAVPIDPTASQPPLALVRSSDPASTAYRLLRNQLLALDRSRRVVQVTAARTGDGATTTAANLAVAFAEHGDPVVVVDADLHRPGLHRAFGVDGSLGLVDNLADESIDMTALPLDPRLTVIAAGPTPTDPSALLASASFEAVIAELRQRFTYVIVDSPALDTGDAPGTDAAMVSRVADAVVVVAGMGERSARELHRAYTDLANAGAPVAGVVANRVHRWRRRPRAT